jgi:hypothetical protein
MSQGFPRRTFLKGIGQSAISLAGATSLGVGSLDASSSTLSPQERKVHIPEHLPPRLTISAWLWQWLVACNPGEPFSNLDKVFAEHTERRFNAIRADVALNWAFDNNGRARGPVEVAPWVPGASENLRVVSGKGGIRYDVLEHVLHMFEMAKKHNVYIIATSWAYQDSTTHLADPKLRQEVFSVPLGDRFELLADLHDRLIQELKKHGLEKQLAFVELHNELDGSDFPKGYLVQKPLVEKALQRLQQAHPDILFDADYAAPHPDNPSFPGYFSLPDNIQVADQHCYTLGVQKALHDLTNTWGTQVPNPKGNSLLNWLTDGSTKISWEEWSRRAERVRRGWWPLMWFFENITKPDRYDYWMFQHFGEYSAMMASLIKTNFRAWGKFARDKGLPAIVDEGYIFYPPLNSRFEESAAGRQLSELVVDVAIEQSYWGVVLSNYIGPSEPMWTLHPEWIRETNQRFLGSEPSGLIESDFQ